MKHLFTLCMIVFLMHAIHAQRTLPRNSYFDFTFEPSYSQGDLFVYTRPFSSGALASLFLSDFVNNVNRRQKTIWIGSEYFLLKRLSIDLMYGQVYGHVPDRLYMNQSYKVEPYFLKDKFNFKSRIALRLFFFRDYYIGVHSTFNRINYGGEQEVVLSWEEFEQIPLNLYNWLGFPIDQRNDYDFGFRPEESVMENQHIVQKTYATQFLMGWSRSIGRFQFEFGVNFGRYNYLNEIKEGNRSVIIPSKSISSIPNKLHMRERYQENTFGGIIKFGYLVNYNSLERFEFNE